MIEVLGMFWSLDFDCMIVFVLVFFVVDWVKCLDEVWYIFIYFYFKLMVYWVMVVFEILFDQIEVWWFYLDNFDGEVLLIVMCKVFLVVLD